METGIYLRVSTEEQAKEGYSIRGQEQKLKDYAKVKDWQIFDVYVDEGISGKNITARPEVNRLIDDIKSGHVKNVLVFKIDRLTRSTSDLIFLVDLFNEHDCTFNSLMESIDTQTASGRMFLKIIGTFAEFERENIAERIILGRERKIQEGYTLCSHTASYGYDRPNGQKIQTIIKSEAQIVREIFDLYANQGISITEIARRLNLRGVPTKHNGKWTTNGVRNLLKNNNYIGEVRHHYETPERSYAADGKHEQIISQEIFDKAQHKLTKNPRISPRKQPMEENYFSGFLICAQCGYKLYTHNIYTTLKDGTRRFHGNYGCGNTVVGACNASNVSAKKLEIAFREYVSEIADFEGNTSIRFYEKEQKKKESAKLIAVYEGKLQKVESKMREALDNYVSNVFNVEEYREVKRQLDNNSRTICNELERLKIEVENVGENSVEIARSLHENWDTLSNKDKRMFLMRFVEKIIVENEKLGEGNLNKKIKIFDIDFRGIA